MNSSTPGAAPARRSRLSLLLLFALFAAPVVLAWSLFYLFPDWRPHGTVNHGTLVQPVRPLPEFDLPTLERGRLGRDFLRGKWTLVYVGRGPCDEQCRSDLARIRQLRLTQGKNIDRLQRLFLWEAAEVPEAGRRDLASAFPGQVIAPLEAGTARDLIPVFAVDGRDPLAARRLYLVDPLGNLMMFYEPDADPRGMVKDLQRLLKYSGLG